MLKHCLYPIKKNSPEACNTVTVVIFTELQTLQLNPVLVTILYWLAFLPQAYLLCYHLNSTSHLLRVYMNLLFQNFSYNGSLSAFLVGIFHFPCGFESLAMLLLCVLWMFSHVVTVCSFFVPFPCQIILSCVWAPSFVHSLIHWWTWSYFCTWVLLNNVCPGCHCWGFCGRINIGSWMTVLFIWKHHFAHFDKLIVSFAKWLKTSFHSQ